MKQIFVTEEEARLIIAMLKNSWAPLDMQKAVYNLINRIERELEN